MKLQVTDIALIGRVLNSLSSNEECSPQGVNVHSRFVCNGQVMTELRHCLSYGVILDNKR